MHKALEYLRNDAADKAADVEINWDASPEILAMADQEIAIAESNIQFLEKLHADLLTKYNADDPGTNGMLDYLLRPIYADLMDYYFLQAVGRKYTLIKNMTT